MHKLIAAALLLGTLVAGAVETNYPVVEPGTQLRFPRDHGSHPEFKMEWWYITGWVTDPSGDERGFQITFFRNRPGVQEQNQSRFAPSQLLLAHAAIADPRHGRLRHDQRAARAGFGLAQAMAGDTAVRIDDWILDRTAGGYVAKIAASTFAMSLHMRAAQPVLLQGERGFSRKGPKREQASYYYSIPHLAVRGAIEIEGKRIEVTGEAWLDHEWSTAYLAEKAAGWDWAGINLADGGALMAFRIRARDGSALWAGGSVREARGGVRVLAPTEVEFTALKRWRSPRTGAEYPVAMRLRAGKFIIDLEPLIDDQELDARASTATVYWEGAVRARVDGQLVGRGYLELTGYFEKLNL